MKTNLILCITLLALSSSAQAMTDHKLIAGISSLARANNSVGLKNNCTRYAHHTGMVPAIKNSLPIACKYDSYNAAEILINTITAKNETVDNYIIANPWGPLQWAARNGNVEITQLLIKNKADVNSRNTALPLHVACGFNQMPIVILLLEHNALINAQQEENGNTALHEACYCGNTQIANYLLSSQKSINVNIINTHKKTALDYACESLDHCMQQKTQFQNKKINPTHNPEQAKYTANQITRLQQKSNAQKKLIKRLVKMGGKTSKKTVSVGYNTAYAAECNQRQKLFMPISH